MICMLHCTVCLPAARQRQTSAQSACTHCLMPPPPLAPSPPFPLPTDDYYGGYENLAMFTDMETGEVDFESAYNFTNFGEGFR